MLKRFDGFCLVSRAFQVRLPTINSDWLVTATVFVFGAVIVFKFGQVLHQRIGHSSPTRRRHGRFVLRWMLVGWLAGAALRLCLTKDGVYRKNQ
jgi:hypothetical protein